MASPGVETKAGTGMGKIILIGGIAAVVIIGGIMLVSKVTAAELPPPEFSGIAVTRWE